MKAVLDKEGAMTEPVQEAAIAMEAAAPAQEVRTGLLEVARERHTELRKLLEKAAGPAEGISGMDADYVHDLRVATRRLSEVAALLEVLTEKASARAISESLKALRKGAGELRDLDVTSEHLARPGRFHMPSAVRKVAGEILEELKGQRPELEKKLREFVGSTSITGAMVLLARIIEENSAADKLAAAEEKLRTTLDKRMKTRARQLAKAFGAAAKKQTASFLHEARIATKKLRYVVELEDKAGANGLKKQLKFLKSVQELLGDHHDVHVLEETVAGHLHTKREKPIAGLARAATKWKRAMERSQAERAAEFFALSYAWMNGRKS